MPRTRLSAAFYLILVFASGILVGVVSHRLYVTSTVNANNTVVQPRTMDEVRKRYLADMRAKVGVNDDQLATVNRILDETKRKFDDLHVHEKPLRDKIQQDQHDAITAVLTDRQKTAFESWRTERARLQAEQQKKQQKK